MARWPLMTWLSQIVHVMHQGYAPLKARIVDTGVLAQLNGCTATDAPARQLEPKLTTLWRLNWVREGTIRIYMEKIEKLRVLLICCLVYVQVSTWWWTLQLPTFALVTLQSWPPHFAEESSRLSVWSSGIIWEEWILVRPFTYKDVSCKVKWINFFMTWQNWAKDSMQRRLVSWTQTHNQHFNIWCAEVLLHSNMSGITLFSVNRHCSLFSFIQSTLSIVSFCPYYLKAGLWGSGLQCLILQPCLCETLHLQYSLCVFVSTQSSSILFASEAFPLWMIRKMWFQFCSPSSTALHPHHFLLNPSRVRISFWALRGLWKSHSAFFTCKVLHYLTLCTLQVPLLCIWSQRRERRWRSFLTIWIKEMSGAMATATSQVTLWTGRYSMEAWDDEVIDDTFSSFPFITFLLLLLWLIW